ncbi:MAG: alpha/beta hydrolase [Verrucomicrobiota bacterium]
MTARSKKRLMLIASGALLLLGVVAIQLPSIGAALILHPVHRHVVATPPNMCQKVTFNGDGVSLQGWRGQGSGSHRGTLIYLHGVSDNRASGAGVMERYRKRGFDVVAYDSRAQGESGGDVSTYGYYEKEDLRRVMDTVAPGPIVLVGTSFGAAVALQAAAIDRRISAVVAAETFSDLRTVLTERAPFFFTPGTIDRAIRLAEQKGHFQLDAVSPTLAARTITAPVLLVHGALDSATKPDHSRRVLAALAGPKRLILVSGAGHNESLRGNVWEDIDRWLDSVLSTKPDGDPTTDE